MKKSLLVVGIFSIMAIIGVVMLMYTAIDARREESGARARIAHLERDRATLCNHIRHDLKWAALLARSPYLLEDVDYYIQLEAGLTTAARHAGGTCIVLPEATQRTLDTLSGDLVRSRVEVQFTEDDITQLDGLYVKALAARGLAVSDICRATLSLEQALEEAARYGWPIVKDAWITEIPAARAERAL